MNKITYKSLYQETRDKGFYSVHFSSKKDKEIIKQVFYNYINAVRTASKKSFRFKDFTVWVVYFDNSTEWRAMLNNGSFGICESPSDLLEFINNCLDNKLS